MADLSSRTRALALVLCGWTLFTWVTRLPLAWSDEELTTGEKVLATLPVALFVGLALVVAGLVLARRPAARDVLLVFAVWTVGYWTVRIVLIATHGHPVGFVVVHALLALTSATLAMLAGLSVRADGPGRVGPSVRGADRGSPVGADS